jgi:hypothetical protein
MARKRHPPIVCSIVMEVRLAGFDPVVVRGKRHFNLRRVGPAGRLCFVVISVSLSCRNAEKKALAEVRRVVRQAEARP